ncbi:GNAT family N-acetyltransferase [Actinocorallia herbida]|nr:GNAT family protein [Actinocorallia herbida]
MKHWPIFGLRVRTPRLELRLPRDSELDALAEVAAAGVHPPDLMPFAFPWTDAPPEKVARNVLQYSWRCLAGWTAQDWKLPLTVFADGSPIGIQELYAQDFTVARHAETGSWLGLAHQGRGHGTEMRAAILELAFTGLGARTVGSAAHTDNPASHAVSRRVGYRENGRRFSAVQGRPVEDTLYLVDRESWSAHRGVETEITGLAPCLPLFGLAEEPEPRGARPR